MLALAGCARAGNGVFRDGATVGDAGTAIDAARDGGGIDAASLDGAALDASSIGDGGRIDAATHDAGGARDAGRDAASEGSSLDPRLDVPPATNERGDSPGSRGECSGIAVCRFYSATEGRCESCTECGNLFAPCSSGEDCDILFVGFEGACTNFCTLGSFECGAPGDCVDIGHPTRGACRPDRLAGPLAAVRALDGSSPRARSLRRPDWSTEAGCELPAPCGCNPLPADAPREQRSTLDAVKASHPPAVHVLPGRVNRVVD